MGETVIVHGNPNHSGYASFLYTGSRHLNLGNKTAYINVKHCSLSKTYNGEMTHQKRQK